MKPLNYTNLEHYIPKRNIFLKFIFYKNKYYRKFRYFLTIINEINIKALTQPYSIHTYTCSYIYTLINRNNVHIDVFVLGVGLELGHFGNHNYSVL